MKKGITIQEAAKEIMRQSQAKADYLVSTANLHMETCDGAPTLRLLDNSGIDRVEPLDILTTAHRQMGSHLNIPWKYYERMLQDNIDLLAQNVNTWLQQGAEQRMIRTIDGQVRAFLSNRYRRIDNIDIARITLPIIQEMPDAIYESCNLSDDYMYIKVVNPRLTAEVVPGDIVQAGVVISNSETGQGAVCVQPAVHRSALPGPGPGHGRRPDGAGRDAGGGALFQGLPVLCGGRRACPPAVRKAGLPPYRSGGGK